MSETFGERAAAWIGGIVGLGARRVAGSDVERAAHERLAAELREVGLTDVELRPFRHNRSLYANMAVHFSVAVLASGLVLAGVAWWIGALLHGAVACSYWLESNKRVRTVRRLLVQHTSQNLIARRPARSEQGLRQRVVVMSHMDAAFTGILFHPKVLKQALKPPPLKSLMFLRKSMFVSTLSVVFLVGVDALYGLGVVTGWLGVVMVVLCTIPALLTVLVNGQIVLQNEVVPGANDNLTGCFALLELSRRVLPDLGDDVEWVCVATGCEEAGTGGSWALVEQMAQTWEPAQTVVIGVDTLSGGTLHYFEEGELGAIEVPRRLRELVERELPQVPKYAIPSGATDALPFLVRGYEAMTFGCVDVEVGAPRNYHYPTDDVAHLDMEQLERSMDQIEVFLRALCAARPSR